MWHCDIWIALREKLEAELYWWLNLTKNGLYNKIKIQGVAKSYITYDILTTKLHEMKFLTLGCIALCMAGSWTALLF